MTDRIQPLSIPAQNPTPHLERFIWFDLLLKITAHPAQMNFYQGAKFFARFSEPAGKKTHAEVHAAYIKIGEVGAIRFMQVIVAVDEVGARRYDHRPEEYRRTGFGGKARRWKEIVANRCTKYTYLARSAKLVLVK